MSYQIRFEDETIEAMFPRKDVCYNQVASCIERVMIMLNEGTTKYQYGRFAWEFDQVYDTHGFRDRHDAEREGRAFRKSVCQRGGFPIVRLVRTKKGVNGYHARIVHQGRARARNTAGQTISIDAWVRPPKASIPRLPPPFPFLPPPFHPDVGW